MTEEGGRTRVTVVGGLGTQVSPSAETEREDGRGDPVDKIAARLADIDMSTEAGRAHADALIRAMDAIREAGRLAQQARAPSWDHANGSPQGTQPSWAQSTGPGGHRPADIAAFVATIREQGGVRADDDYLGAMARFEDYAHSVYPDAGHEVIIAALPQVVLGELRTLVPGAVKRAKDAVPGDSRAQLFRVRRELDEAAGAEQSKGRAARELMVMTQGDDERAADFATRFRAVSVRAGVGEDDIDANGFVTALNDECFGVAATVMSLAGEDGPGVKFRDIERLVKRAEGLQRQRRERRGFGLREHKIARGDVVRRVNKTPAGDGEWHGVSEATVGNGGREDKREPPTCYNCQEVGHIYRFCPHRERNKDDPKGDGVGQSTVANMMQTRRTYDEDEMIERMSELIANGFIKDYRNL
jgi:hypothetical protein